MLRIADGFIRGPLPQALCREAMSVPGYRWDPDAQEWCWPACRANGRRLYCLADGDVDFDVQMLADMMTTARVIPQVASNTAPWQHQRDAYEFAEMLRRHGQPAVLFAMEMGTGKSKVAVDLLDYYRRDMALVVAPKSAVAGVWPGQFARHSCRDWRVETLAFGSTAKSLDAARSAVASVHRPLALVINYDAVWREPLAKWICQTKIDALVLDECCVSGTLVEVPGGRVPIERLRDGDLVLGVDENGSVVSTPVIGTPFSRIYSGKVYECAGCLRVTDNHPIWTGEHGYVPARDLDSVKATVLRYGQGGACYAHANVRVVREGVPGSKGNIPREAPEVLRHELLGSVADDAAGDQGESTGVDRQGALQGSDECAQGEAGRSGETEGAPRRTRESVQAPRDTEEGATRPGAEGVELPERGERDPDACSAKASAGATWPRLAGGVHRQNGAEGSASDSLQDRHRGSGAEGCRGGRREQPPKLDRDREGLEEGCVPQVGGMDGDPREERRGDGRPGSVRKASDRGLPVYNIETGTGNYFANGILVHNCHRAKDPGGRASRFLHALSHRIPYRIGLTGTPMPHSPLDVYGYFRALDDRIFGTVHSNFMARYARIVQRETRGGQRYPEVVGLLNTEELHERFYSITYRVQTADLPELNLPGSEDIRLECEMPPAARKVYESLRDEFICWLENGEAVTAANAAVRVLKLQQIAAGTLKTGDETWQPLHEAKLDLLRDWCEDTAEPAVIACHFRADLDRCAEALRKMGRTVSMLDGRHNDLAAWQAGDTQFLILQEQAGSEGIDLTRARYLLTYSGTFRLATHQQLRARVLRPGQSRFVRYYHLVCLRTVDEQILRALERREDLIRSILDGTTRI